jgi:cytochrome c oxidase subunit 2
MKFDIKRWVVLGVSLLLGGCAPYPTFLDPASPIAGHEASLYRIILIMALVVFVLVEGAIILILIRDRGRKGDNTLPKQVYGNTKLEVTWTAIPILLVIALFVMTVQTMHAVAAPAPEKSDLNVQVTGHQWWWEFSYPDLGITTANELHIPLGGTVQITLASVDVIHSFWVPQLSGKTDVIPGQTNHMWLKGEKIGVYHGQCAEFCGTNHANMRFKVIVESQADFNTWAASQQKDAPQPQTDAEKQGYKMITTGICSNCHTLNGTDAKGTIGPNLTHLFSRTSFAGSTFDLNQSNLRSWLQDTQAMKPGNDMVVKLKPDEIDALIAYLTQLK